MSQNKSAGIKRYENLEGYVDEYMHPTAARTVDQKVLHLVVDRVVDMLDGQDILEMGFGDGAWTGKIIERFGKTHIVDASSELLKIAKERYGDPLTTYQAHFEEFKPPKLFDTVLCTYVLEHVLNPVTVLAQCRTWLKPCGLVFVTVPNASSLHRRLGTIIGIQKDAFELGPSDRSIGHRRVYNASKMEADLSQSGFKVERKMNMMFKPLPNSLLTHLSDLQIEGLFKLGDEIPEDERSILAYFCRPIG